MVSLGKSRLNTVITFFYPSKISYSFILMSSGSNFLSLVEAGQTTDRLLELTTCLLRNGKNIKFIVLNTAINIT